jgi:hypothetical protein
VVQRRFTYRKEKIASSSFQVSYVNNRFCDFPSCSFFFSPRERMNGAQALRNKRLVTKLGTTPGCLRSPELVRGTRSRQKKVAAGGYARTHGSPVVILHQSFPRFNISLLPQPSFLIQINTYCSTCSETVNTLTRKLAFVAAKEGLEDQLLSQFVEIESSEIFFVELKHTLNSSQMSLPDRYFFFLWKFKRKTVLHKTDHVRLYNLTISWVIFTYLGLYNLTQDG